MSNSILFVWLRLNWKRPHACVSLAFTAVSEVSTEDFKPIRLCAEGTDGTNRWSPWMFLNVISLWTSFRWQTTLQSQTKGAVRELGLITEIYCPCKLLLFLGDDSPIATMESSRTPHVHRQTGASTTAHDYGAVGRGISLLSFFQFKVSKHESSVEIRFNHILYTETQLPAWERGPSLTLIPMLICGGFMEKCLPRLHLGHMDYVRLHLIQHVLTHGHSKDPAGIHTVWPFSFDRKYCDSF